MIAEGSDASADRVISGLRSAFKDKNTKGVVLRINSPGGTPVQAGYINDEIGRLRDEYPDIPLYAVVTDICASGGYYVAVAADRIYADKSSVIGSIGVLVNGFGFVGAMEKLGVERRLLTAGKHKGFLDPFSPADPEEVSHLQSVLKEIHQAFIDTVRKGRGDRLRGEESELFNGLVWSGKQAIRLGLADELGSSSYVAREVIGAEEIVDFTWERDYLERFAERFGAAVTEALTTQAGSRHLW
ncbi:MAG: protease-4 [Candidatus Kentron sp. G]|nr:MAG: protease-4 [Candidatus Kentron sp. G]VFN03404.1 MAG: protease-4 [Candidatus Kentron sp. G]VFN03471.1 MAG: protease-4 [Candidatus Kentron sp. G]